MLYTAFQHNGPAAIRYPRGTGPGAIIAQEMVELELGKAVQVRTGEHVAILSFGTLLPAAMEAAMQLNATVVDMRWVKPMDESTVIALADSHQLLVTLEENTVTGGAGAGVNEILAKKQRSNFALNLGLPNSFVEHGGHSQQLAFVELDAQGVTNSIRRHLSDKHEKPIQVETIELLSQP
jgi:1-deoxy-D-xylulose-5-phosphate synthase